MSEPLPRIGKVSSLADIPAVASYLQRIEAEAVSLNRAVIRRVVDGYPRDVGQVRFGATGQVSVSGSADGPNALEAEQIAASFDRVEFPQPITLAAVSEPPEGVDLTSPDVFVCHDFDGRVAMLHQRYQTRDGGKGFVPWTRWSDGCWHKLEPDVLPFFGLPGHEQHSTLVLHEGPKGARHLKAVIADEANTQCPWVDELRHAHHVGWLGGVHAVNRSDWPSLAARGWSRVIIVADNDDNGLMAARQIAEHFAANVWIVAFDQRFPASFDLADEWPADLFDPQGRYIGPPLRDFLIPATKATLMLPGEGRGRPTAVLRDEFASLVAYTADPPRIIFRHNPSRDRRLDEFNTIVRPLSDVKDTAAKIHGRIECQHDRIVYRPGFLPGTLSVDGSRCFNVYEGSGIAPLSGDHGPWNGYLAHLVPDEGEREQMMLWLATLIARPKVRMRYGLLLISRQQGVGKNTLGSILRTLLGPSNVSFPSESSVVESAFNGWAARRRLIFISEFYSGTSRKAYDKLKPLITDDLLEVNEKGVNQYELENWATVIACSNSEAALYLDDEDRRWFVPAVTESKKPPEWWRELYTWLEGDGPGIILQWASDYVAEHGNVRTGDHAPSSKRKQAIADASRSEGQQLAISLGEHLASKDARTMLRVRDVWRWIARMRGLDLGARQLERPATITAALKKVSGLTIWADAKRPKFGATRDSVVMNFVPDADATWADIKEHLTDLEGAGLDEPL
jgi:hypothetical protein